MIVAISILSLVTAIAVPNFTMMVQNNRIKSAANHIVGSLQFARKTANINQTTVTACPLLPGNLENCASTYQWKTGIALIQGDAKVEDFTPPSPPDEPVAPRLSLVPLPPLLPEPTKPQPVEFISSYVKNNSHWKNSDRKNRPGPIIKADIDRFSPVTGIRPGYPGACGKEYYTSGKHDTRYSKNALAMFKAEIVIAYKNSSGELVEYIEEYPAQEICLFYFSSGGGKSWERYARQEKIQDYLRAADQKRLSKIKEIQISTEKEMVDFDIKMKQYQKSKEDLANAQKNNKKIEEDYQKDLMAYKQYYLSWQQDMEKYYTKIASMPGRVVTLDKAKVLLSNNSFDVTITPRLQDAMAAVVYGKDRVKGFGEIYIEDARGRGEHSRTICINMLGNIKVVKGNESCP